MGDFSRCQPSSHLIRFARAQCFLSDVIGSSYRQRTCCVLDLWFLLMLVFFRILGPCLPTHISWHSTGPGWPVRPSAPPENGGRVLTKTGFPGGVRYRISVGLLRKQYVPKSGTGPQARTEFRPERGVRYRNPGPKNGDKQYVLAANPKCIACNCKGLA